MRKEKRRYRLLLEADYRPNDEYAALRIKRLLKALLRVYALRCVEIEPAKEANEQKESVE